MQSPCRLLAINIVLRYYVIRFFMEPCPLLKHSPLVVSLLRPGGLLFARRNGRYSCGLLRRLAGWSWPGRLGSC